MVAEGAQQQPHSVSKSKAKMVVNLIKKFTHHSSSSNSPSTISSSEQSSSSSAKKNSNGRLDHELERLNSKIVSPS